MAPFRALKIVHQWLKLDALRPYSAARLNVCLSGLRAQKRTGSYPPSSRRSGRLELDLKPDRQEAITSGRSSPQKANAGADPIVDIQDVYERDSKTDFHRCDIGSSHLPWKLEGRRAFHGQGA